MSNQDQSNFLQLQIRVWLRHLYRLGWLPVGRLGRGNVSRFLSQEEAYVQVPGRG